MDNILTMSACDVVSLLKQNQVSPLELIDIAEARIQEVEEQINAVPILCIDRAKKKAKELKDRQSKDLPPNYLYGLPILVKDLTEVEGVKTTYGSPIFKDNVSPYSNFLVETLEKNGAIVMGKTNTPEFGAGGNTFNEVFGFTRNPWNTAMNAGGSSGGSAAALPFDVTTRYLEELEGTAFDTYIDWLTIVFAITAMACPCISIPCGFSRSGLPVGLQIVGAPRRDDLVISAAASFEKIFNLSSLTPIDPRI